MITEQRRIATMPWVLLGMVSLPFVVLVGLLITSSSNNLQNFRRFQQIIDVFVVGQTVLHPMEDMAAYGPVHMLIADPDLDARFEHASDKVPAALDAFHAALSAVGDPSTSSYSETLQADWSGIDMTSSTSSAMDAHDAIQRVMERVYRSMTSLIYFLDINGSEEIPVSELLMLSVEDMRSARAHAGALHAMTLFVARRGGYIGSSDAEVLEQNWAGLESDLQGLRRRLESLDARGLAPQFTREFSDVLQQVNGYLDFVNQEVLLADRVEISWQQADQQSQALAMALRQLTAGQLDVARVLLEQSRRHQLLRDLLLAVGLFALYVIVAGIGILFYRSREKMMHALAENKAKSQFLARMSHEIRTPLNGVIGLAELLRATSPTAQQRKYISLIDSAGRSLVSLVNDILDYAKIEAGKLQLDAREFDLRALISETAQMFSLQLNENRNLLLSVVDNQVPVCLRGDETRIRQVLINLIGNAVKFTHNGCVEVRVSCRRQEQGAVVLRFEVQDSGIGLSPDEQQQLFGLFSQASADVTRRYGGTGLGLSISRELVRLMGGDIDVVSAHNWGSTFWFDLALPYAASSAAEASMPVPPDQPVLLVDAAGTLTRLVQAAGDKLDSVESVSSFSAAREAMQQGRAYALMVYYIDGDSPGKSDLQQARELSALCGQRLRIVTGIRGVAGLDDTGIDNAFPEVQEHIIHRSVFTLEQLVGVFSLEADSGDCEADAPEDGAELAALSGLRVMVAEDNPVNQLVTQGYLARLDIDAVVVEDGRAAVQLYREQQGRVDVILMDLDMPVLDGASAARQIRALEQSNGWRRCRILALSAHALPEYAEQVRLAGMDGQLVKPVTVSQLAAALEQSEGAEL